MSTVNEILDDENLVTDACPHPPRSEETVVEEPESAEKIPIVSTESSLPRLQQKRTKQSKTKPKTANGPIANIINIANCNGVHIGKSISYNIQKPATKSEEKVRNYVKTPSIKSLLNSNEWVNRDHIIFVSSHVGEGWKDVGRLLNYSEGQIYQFEENHIIRGVKEVVYQLLLDWVQNEPEHATIGRLTSVLWDARQEDVVDRFSKNFSS